MVEDTWWHDEGLSPTNLHPPSASGARTSPQEEGAKLLGQIGRIELA
jgi:hypothetical protein